MSGRIEGRLAELGITLPVAAAPVANYVPFVRTGNLVHVSGQVSRDAAGPICGRLGETMETEAGAGAARTCALALIAQLREACGGDLDRVVRVVKLVGFVNSAPAFTDQPRVVNGASDVMVEVFGEAGRHARSAVGAGALPLGVAVEVEGIFEIA
ncbi:MAG: RidA family protein [Rubellimicrobium sp.]|nr:RidA family protein [Rubellimicrobium sp.]